MEKPKLLLSFLSIAFLGPLCLSRPADYTSSASTDSPPSASTSQTSNSEYDLSYSSHSWPSSSSESAPSHSKSPIPSDGKKKEKNSPSTSKSTAITTNKQEEVRPPSSRRFNLQDFLIEMRNAGLKKSATASEIETSTKDILKKYVGNPNAGIHLYRYLHSIGIDSDQIALFRDQRNRIRNRESHFRKRLREANKGTETYTAINSPGTARTRCFPSQNTSLETRLNAQAVRLRHFKSQLEQAGLYYDMDPNEYASLEVPLRLKMQTHVYGAFQMKLMRLSNVDPEWKAAYRRAVRNLRKLRNPRRGSKRRRKNNASASEAEGEGDVLTSMQPTDDPTSSSSWPYRTNIDKDSGGRNAEEQKEVVEGSREATESHSQAAASHLNPLSLSTRPSTVRSPAKQFGERGDSSGQHSSNSKSLMSEEKGVAPPASSSEESEDERGLDERRAAGKQPRKIMQLQERPTTAAKTYRGGRSREQVATIRPTSFQPSSFHF